MKRFVLTADHIKLLRAANVQWEACEYGAPAIDCKRPYGNSDVEADMMEMFGVDASYDANGDYKPDTLAEVERLRTLHRETETALQVILAHGRMEPGVYVASDYSRDWQPEAANA